MGLETINLAAYLVLNHAGQMTRRKATIDKLLCWQIYCGQITSNAILTLFWSHYIPESFGPRGLEPRRSYLQI